MASLTYIDLGLSAGELNSAIESCPTPYLAFTEKEASYDSGYFESLADALDGCTAASFAKGVLMDGKERVKLDEWAKGESRIVDCSEDYLRALVYPCGTVFRKRALQSSGVSFSPDLEFCRDECFSLSCSALMPSYLLCPDFQYRSPRVFDESSQNTPQSNQLGWYEELVDNLPALLKNVCVADGVIDLPRQVQFGLLYLLVQRFKSNSGSNLKHFFGDVDFRDLYLAKVGRLMLLISNEVLFRHSVATKMPRRTFLYLAWLRDPRNPLKLRANAVRGQDKNSGQGFLFVDDQPGIPKGEVIPAVRFTEQRLAIFATHLTKTRKGRPAFEFVCSFARAFPQEKFRLFMCNRYAHRDHVVEMEPLTMVTGRQSYFDLNVYSNHAYKVVVPLGPRLFSQKISAYALIDGVRVNLKLHVRGTWQAKLQEDEPLNVWSIPNFVVGHNGGCVHVAPANEKKKAQIESEYQEHLKTAEGVPDMVLKLRREYLARKKEFEGCTIWAYYDKSFKAGDNGEHAYRYAMHQDDGIEKVFFINPNCPDAARLKEEGFKVLSPGSLEGKLYALNADVIFMTHVPPYLKMGFNKTLLTYFIPLLDAKVVRLYHGFPNNQSATYAQCNADCAAVVVGSYYERDLYTNEENGFKPEQIIESGNPRYDGLVDDSRRQILFAPTWRPGLAGRVSGGKAQYNPDFKNSLYCQMYSRILSDEKLLETARRTGYKIKMFLHPKLSAQTVDFESNDVVEPLSCVGDMDYVTIMRQSDLMVTDFSSVQYDFASMHKPVVYYHDPVLPYWRVVDFDYEKYGFGEICESVQNLVDVLCCYMERDCAMTDFYDKRIRDFFIRENDHRAAERLYEAVRLL